MCDAQKKSESLSYLKNSVPMMKLFTAISVLKSFHYFCCHSSKSSWCFPHEYIQHDVVFAKEENITCRSLGNRHLISKDIIVYDS